MTEDVGLCTYVRHHKQKIAMFLAAMRHYRDGLRERGCDVHYEELRADGPADVSYEEQLERWVQGKGIRRLRMWEIEDKFFEERIGAFAASRGLTLEILESPVFLTSREEFARYLAESGKPSMAQFYRRQRRRLGVLMDQDGEPWGGRWSFDAENRKPLPGTTEPPGLRPCPPTPHVKDAIVLVNRFFADHPGELSESGWWLPVTRSQALGALRAFLDDRFASFGDYEDALSARDPFLFHSVLSPALNLGLITPDEVIERAIDHAGEHGTPPNSLEGFVRQVIGWREFVRGIYRHFSERQEKENFFGHTRGLASCWYDGTTGLLPLDDVIRKALRYGWTHHIERLMVVANLMNLCEIEPGAAYRWFMEMYVDSSDWVMGPNVYGMGLMSDGGVFATKTYICGSNYILKMSDYRKPRAAVRGEPTWCDIMDGLYWRFIDRHRKYFASQPRMAVMPRSLDRMPANRRRFLFAAAEAFLRRVTV